MPGLSYQRSTASIETHLSYFFLLTTDHETLDRITSSDSVQPPKAQPCPLVPTKHKTCKPSYSQASWMMHIKEDECRGFHSYKWPVNSKSCPKQFNIENGDGDKDLATMVHDFIENGSCGCEHYDSNESDNISPSPEMLCNNLQALTSAFNSFERDIKSVVEVVLSTHNAKDIACKVENTECKGGCVRSFVAHHLRSLRYNAAICDIKWQNSGKLLGGEYEYIDVISDDGYEPGDRIVIDLDFQSQFEIARPTQHYLAALKLLPMIFVGPCKKLEEILCIMSEAAKYSLKQNSMHLPPWRTLDYMCAKWLTPCDRKLYDISSSLFKGHSNPHLILGQKERSLASSESNQCLELVKRIKASCHKDETERKVHDFKKFPSRVGKSYLIRKKSNAW
ncbi:hypothetical protein O6H91_13G085200 [Diphasiastrum complanatum]|uniref:Uncharacterized protein n=2 Tax=Diphasiastrum complanatum TaxID=34168 RepID=A0ACC2BWV0_DIPCM|nr:hypothetical protein O6H91_Y459200 [Diphasiastrum complanatum]KAJ7534239.1 hypothetical protein O6H91_13G085200 [Diphasiastrum complanatum]KAJ7534240.1 hypothetical protein O6H91_13G085200 [Diphasiastrum complanatum]